MPLVSAAKQLEDAAIPACRQAVGRSQMAVTGCDGKEGRVSETRPSSRKENRNG
jgi:hypothetical protein